MEIEKAVDEARQANAEGVKTIKLKGGVEQSAMSSWSNRFVRRSVRTRISVSTPTKGIRRRRRR